MAHSNYSPSPSPVFAPSEVYDSSDLEDLALGEPSNAGLSRPTSPLIPDSHAEEAETGVDTMTCRWEDCGKVFNHLPTLIDHIHNDHIGVHKSNYTCEWATCSRRGIAQTSRFALISHIRSHTGEKPFICPRPECDKSFTRSDALAKHMRIQHNISPPLPGRGGNRKRKREESDPVAHPPDAGYNTFKVDPGVHDSRHSAEFDDGRISPIDVPVNNNSIPPPMPRPITPDYGDDMEDEIPPHLLAQMDPVTKLIMGRTPAQVRYILMKMKYTYALEQHEALIEELRVVRHEEKCWRERKEAVLDELLRIHFGPEAEELTSPLVLPLVPPPPPPPQQQQQPPKENGERPPLFVPIQYQ